jgi:hypothetical protein
MVSYAQCRAAVLLVALPACCFADSGQDAIVKANALFREGKVRQAETLLRSASAADPNSTALHGALGELLL